MTIDKVQKIAEELLKLTEKEKILLIVKLSNKCKELMEENEKLKEQLKLAESQLVKAIGSAEQLIKLKKEVGMSEEDYVNPHLEWPRYSEDKKSKELKKLQLENNVLKEQLKLAESQIDDLKQQVDELNKAVYQENGED